MAAPAAANLPSALQEQHLKSEFIDLAVLDFAPYLTAKNDEEKDRLLDGLVAQLTKASEEIGFYFITGVEALVPDAEVREMFDFSKRLFALDFDEKVKLTASGKGNTGYIPNMGDPVNPERLRVTGAEDKLSILRITTSTSSFNESFLISNGHGNGFDHNRFPDDAFPGMRQVADRYDAGVRRLVSEVILPALARALGMPLAELRSKFQDPLTVTKLLHYPETPATDNGKLYGIFPHIDQNFLSILAQNDTPGLSLKLPSGTWVAVPALPKTFLVNTGEMLHRLSNGRFRATVHRVTSFGQERFSVVNFLTSDRKELLYPVVSPGEEARWKPFTAVDFFRESMAPPKPKPKL